MENFDVIIVGAGPGGLKCAEILSKSDKKVLLLEKNPKIGPKICAGGLTRKSLNLLNLPSELIENSYDSCVFHAPKISARLEFGKTYGCTVNREKLGQWQLEKIKNSSVMIKTSAEVSKITGETVELANGETFGYKYLVGADGSNSLVRRFLKIPTKRIAIAFQYLISEKFSDIEIFFDSKLFNSWYAWIFPHKDFASVGFGCYPTVMPINTARKNFEYWANKKNIDILCGKFESFPINCDYRGFNFGSIFLVGDAAGFVSGFTGEGIYQALISGEEAANIILNPAYKPIKIKQIRREVRIHHLMLFLVWLSGPLRNQLFNFVTLCVKNKFLAKTLARILT